MATPSLRLPENVSGRFYVTSDCIDCDLCRAVAPKVFQRHEVLGVTVVVHQPTTDVEHQLAMEGLDCCPVEAIGCEAT